MITAERLLELASTLLFGRDHSHVQTSEAIDAATVAIREAAEADLATSDATVAVDTLKTLAASFSLGSTPEEFAALVAAVQNVGATRDVQLVEVGQATEAATKRIQEAADAEMAAAEYAAKIAEFKTAANEYVEE